MMGAVSALWGWQGKGLSPGHFPFLVLGVGGFCTVFLAVTWRHCRGGANGEQLVLVLVGSIVAAVTVNSVIVEFDPHLAWLVISIRKGEGMVLTCVGVAKSATAVVLDDGGGGETRGWLVGMWAVRDLSPTHGMGNQKGDVMPWW